MTWKDLLKAMEVHHSPIAKYFRTGYGLELMRKDADIAENILLHFVKQNIPCLPVHDSFIIHYELKDELLDLMQREYKKMFKETIGTKIDDGFELYMEEYKSQSLDGSDIDRILDEEQDSQYHKRLNQWWEHYNS